MITNSQTYLAQLSNKWSIRAAQYAEAAIADKKQSKFCKYVRLAAKRFVSDLQKQKTINFPYYYDQNEAARACEFFSLLPHVEGSWDSPTVVLEDWQVFIICNIFGWRRVSDGRRRFDTVYIEVPRKNGKSFFASGIALFCLCMEGEKGPQIKCAATTGDQARIVFDVAKAMVNALPKLRAAFDVQAFKDTIACYKSGGNIKPINAKASTQDGLNPHCSILDELHAHKTRDLFDVLKSARGARKNPLSLYITTAGYNTLGVCYEQHKFLKKILEAVITADHYFGVIFTIDERDDPLDENVWQKANPNWRVINQTELKNYAIEARNSPEMMAEFKTKRLNVWTTAKNGHINIIKWQKCDAAVDLESLKSVPCWGGFDLASTSDLTALALIWKHEERVKCFLKFWLPEEVIEGRSEKNGIPYKHWADLGLITATPGAVTDYQFIEEEIYSLMNEFKIKCFAYDPWNSRDLVNRLMQKNVPLIEFRQGPASFNNPMREIDRLYIGKTLDHGGNPVLTWNASNLITRKDANGNLAPDKKNSSEKIDGYVALAMACGIMMANVGDQLEGESVYEDRGIVEIEI